MNDHDESTSEQGQGKARGKRPERAQKEQKETTAMDPYQESTSGKGPGGETGDTPLVSPGSQGALGQVEAVAGFNEADMLQEALGLGETVQVTPEQEALPPAGEIEFQQPETVCGVDDRVRISPASGVPWRWNCQLIITMGNGGGSRCTGWFIGPRTVMTAGHCVFSHSAGGWARQIEVIPAMDAASRPFGSQVGNSFRSVVGWTSSANPEYDYGSIILPNPNLGNAVGFFGFASLADSSLLGLIGNNAGYPGDKPFGTQWFNADPISEVTSRRLGYMIDTFGGQSGSAVWRLADGQRHAVGIHGYGGCPNRAVRINQAVFNNMLGWKNV